MLEKIRRDQPHNETRRAMLANYAAIMGRAAVHSGQLIAWDRIRRSDFRFSPTVDELDYDSPAPVHDDAQGQYPVPIPGQWSEV